MRCSIKVLFFVALGFQIAPIEVQAQEPTLSTPSNVKLAIDQYQSGDRDRAFRQLLKLGYSSNIAAQVNLGAINYVREDRVLGAKEAKFWFVKAA